MKKIITHTNTLIMTNLFAWASAYIGIRIGLHSYSPGSLGFFRFLIASIILIPFYIIGKKNKKMVKLRFYEIIIIMLLGVLGIGFYAVALNYGEITTLSSIASFIITQSPVIIVLLSVIFFSEKINIYGIIGIIISFLGICLIAKNQSHGWHFDTGVISVALAAIAGSLFSILQKPLFKKIPAIQIAIIAIWGATISLAIFIPQLFHDLPNATINSTLAAIYLGIIPSAIGYITWSVILSRVSAVKAAGYLYVIPLITTVMGFFIGEFPLLMELTGGIIALGGAVITHFSKIKTQEVAE